MSRVVVRSPTLHPAPANENFVITTVRHCRQPVRERLERASKLGPRRRNLLGMALRVLSVPAHALERKGSSANRGRGHRLARTQIRKNPGKAWPRTFRKTDGWQDFHFCMPSKISALTAARRLFAVQDEHGVKDFLKLRPLLPEAFLPFPFPSPIHEGARLRPLRVSPEDW